MTTENNEEQVAAESAAFQLSEPPPIRFYSKHEYDSFVADDLVQLHKALLQFAPVNGVSGLGLDMTNYRVDYDASATQEQKDAAAAFLLGWPDYRQRQRTLAHNYAILDDWFKTKVVDGCQISVGFRLGLSDRDITLLSGNYMLAQTAATMGMPLPQIIDIDGNAHDVATVEDYTQIMLEYGNYRASLSKEYAAKKAEIDAAMASL